MIDGVFWFLLGLNAGIGVALVLHRIGQWRAFMRWMSRVEKGID